jgi:hypothetical protein
MNKRERDMRVVVRKRWSKKGNKGEGGFKNEV